MRSWVAVLTLTSVLASHDSVPTGPTSCQNFAFVNIPEAGGRTVTRAYTGETTEAKTFVNSLRHECGACGTTHGSIALAQMTEWGEDNWNSAYTMAVISNPFQWIANLFFWEKMMCWHFNQKEQLETTAGVPFYICSLNETQMPTGNNTNTQLFRMWLSNADSYAHATSTRFLLPHPVALTTSTGSAPTSQYAYVSDSTATGLLVTHFTKAEDTSAMVQVSNAGLFTRLLCENVPESYDSSNTSRIETPHPAAIIEDLYDDATCEIVRRRLSFDFIKFNYSEVCPHTQTQVVAV